MNSIIKICSIALLLFLVYFSQSLKAQSKILDKEITIAFDDESLKDSLVKLEAEAGISTAYNELDIKNSKVTITFERELLGEVLKALLKNENLDYKVVGNTVAIFKKESAPVASTAKEIQTTKERTIQKQAQKFTVSGYIMDEKSSETLIAATLYCKELQVGTSTNEYGFFSLTIPEGRYELSFSYIGYLPKTEVIELNQNKEISVYLSPNNKLEEIVIVGDDKTKRHSETKMSSHTISLEKVKSMPVLMGERDVLKMIQLMPGIQSGSEGSSGLYVRGGGPDQNLMLLDGVPVYNANHLFGFVSVFNGDAIKSVELIKGGFPARYGGRLSSIIDIRMKEGNMKEIKGDITMGIISGRFNLEGPIVKDKTSFSFSGRRTWIDLFTTPAQRIINKSKSESDDPFNGVSIYNLYDINAKINHKFSPKSRLYLSSYLGNDKLAFENRENFLEEDGKITWGNNLVTARWNYQFNQKLFSNTTVYFSRYNFDFKDEFKEVRNNKVIERSLYQSNSDIKDYAAKIDFNFIPHPNHYIRTGVKYGIYQFTPTTSFELLEGEDIPTINITNAGKEIQGNEFSAYAENDMSITARIKLNAGVHFANFKVENTNYTSVQPRAALSFQLSPSNSIKASATKMTQFLHLLANPSLGLPTDLWVSSTEKIKPENSWQYGLGFNQSFSKGYELTVEGYYKEMDNVLEYKSGFSFFSNGKEWEEKVEAGDGNSFGAEILFEKTKGKTTGWLGYTLSKSTRTFENINFGETFPYKYDRRHDIGIAITHKKNEKLDFGLVWVYGTGNTYTLGTSNYTALGIFKDGFTEGDMFNSLGITNNIESRNNQRMPAYHRLDLSVNLHKQKKRFMRTWSFGVYNAYSRQNPFVVYSTEKDNVPILRQQSLLPIVPSASYTVKF